MSREEVIQVLLNQLRYLSEGLEHPDAVAWIFIHYITLCDDSTLIDVAPMEIKVKIDEIISNYRRDGNCVMYGAKGGKVDHTAKVRRLAELLER